MYKGKFRRAFPESFLFFHSFFYALTAGRRRRDILRDRLSGLSFFMSAYMGGGTNHNAGKCSAPHNTLSTVDNQIKRPGRGMWLL